MGSDRAVRILICCVFLGIFVSCQEDRSTEPKVQTISFQQSELTVREPDHIGSGVSIPIARSDASHDAVVTVQVLSLTADDSDFRMTDRRVLFPEGRDTAHVFVEVLPDTLAEGEESLAVRLDSIPPGYSIGPRSRVTIHILDRSILPNAPTVTFLQPEIIVREGARDAPYRGIRIPIVRSVATEPLTLPLDVRYLTAGPEDLGDYGRPSSRTWTFEPGVDTLWVRLEPLPDAEIEGEERLSLRLGLPSPPYELGWWPELMIRIQDVEVHHVAMPAEWPLAVGDSWSYEFEWESYGGTLGSDDRLLLESAEVTGEMQFRGREYKVFQTSQYWNSHETDTHSILLAQVADSLLFIPSTDTTRMPASMKDSLPWVLATFSGPDSVDRTYPGYYGQQRRVESVSVPAGSWDNVLEVKCGLGCLPPRFQCWDGGDEWTFYLVADVGPIRMEHRWCEPDYYPDNTCGSETAGLTSYTIRR